MAEAKGNGLSSAANTSAVKVVVHFQTLDKMNLAAQVRSLNSDDIQQVRYVSSRILQHIAALDKNGKDNLIKNSFYIQSLLTCLELNRDIEILRNVISVFVELIGKTNTGTRASQLVLQGSTQVFFQILVRETKSENPDDFIVQLHSILSKLAPKDRKFGVKARLSQALCASLSFMRCHTHAVGMRNLQPVLTVLKQYSSNALNASFLGKNGAISNLFKILSNLNKKNAIMTKTALDTMALLVKSKSNSARAVGYGGVPILLQMYSEWHRLDNKNRYVSLRKSILNILKHITNLKSGRQAVIDADGVRLIYRTCEEIMDVRELESLIFIASLILRKCFPRQKLMVNASKSALLYKLPESEFHTPHGLSKDAAQLMGVSLTADAQDDDDSSLDNDDDLSSDDERDNTRQDNEQDGCSDRSEEPISRRPVEDLMMYEKFFPEVNDVEVIDEFSRMDLFPSRIKTPLSSLTHNAYSMPTLPISRATVLQGSLKDLNFLDEHQSSAQSARSTLAPPGILFDVRSKRDALDSMDGSVSAVNVKTGQAVFSLDLPISSMQLSPRVKPRAANSLGLKQSTKGPVTAAINSVLQVEQPDDSGCLFSDETEVRGNLLYEHVSPQEFFDIVKKTKSVGRFSKVTYPDLYGIQPFPADEPLYERKFGVQRAKIFEDIDRMINPDALINRVVYDYDEIVKEGGSSFIGENSVFVNQDELRVGRPESPFDHLHFNSQFECGNLRKAIQVRECEYDLILCPDVNTNRHHQWFYFEVSNMRSGKPYRFNIINNEKLNSQFNFGMQPVMFSVQSALNGRPYWLRVGTDICYFKNHLTRSSQVTGGVKGKLYYTTTFSVTFEHAYDVCYLAYHYPYSFTSLQCQLHMWEKNINSSAIYFRRQTLCQSVAGNAVDVITITNFPTSCTKEGVDQFRSKPYIFLSSRVHPGESNASWVMKGTIEHLLSDSAEAQALRDAYIFKIVPMLNPDGVINGNHRCSLSAEDLNRRWLVTCPKLHPTIYHTKGLLQFMKHTQRIPLVYCDYHGHSRRKNVFFYGCSPTLSWMNDDLDNPTMLSDRTEDPSYKTLPRVLSQIAPAFSLANCSFVVEKSKESTARVVVWRQIGVVRSYTMESSYCGCDQGPFNGLHINISHLENMGKRFADALLKVKSRHFKPTVLSEQSMESRPGLINTDETIGQLRAHTTEEEYLDDNLSEDISEDNEEEDDIDEY